MDRERLVSLGYTFSEKSNGWWVYFRKEVIARGSFGCNAQSSTKKRSKRRMIEAATAHFVMNRVKPPEDKPYLIPLMPRHSGKSALIKWYADQMDKMIYDTLKISDVEVPVRDYSARRIALLGELRRGSNRRSNSADPRNALPKSQPPVRRGQGVHHVRHHRAQKRS